MTEGEPTPLSAARARDWAGPTAEFSNRACVNHAPRVRQRRAAPGPAPPTSQPLNGYNAAAPSFLPRLDWNSRQCKGSALFLSTGSTFGAPSQGLLHTILSQVEVEAKKYTCVIYIILVLFLSFWCYLEPSCIPKRVLWTTGSSPLSPSPSHNDCDRSKK